MSDERDERTDEQTATPFMSVRFLNCLISASFDFSELWYIDDGEFRFMHLASIMYVPRYRSIQIVFLWLLIIVTRATTPPPAEG